MLTLLMPGCCAFQFNVGWSSEMQFCFVYPQTWASTQPPFCVPTLDFHLYFVVLRKTGRDSIFFPSKGWGCLLFHVRSLSVCLSIGARLLSCSMSLETLSPSLVLGLSQMSVASSPSNVLGLSQMSV